MSGVPAGIPGFSLLVDDQEDVGSRPGDPVQAEVQDHLLVHVVPLARNGAEQEEAKALFSPSPFSGLVLFRNNLTGQGINPHLGDPLLAFDAQIQ